MLNKFPKRTGIYHIRDNIDCLQLRLRFRYVNTLLQLPHFEFSAIASGQTAGKHRVEEEERQVMNEIHMQIGWQQKILSSWEREHYKDKGNCLTPTQRKYHEWLLEEQAKHDALQQKLRKRKKAAKRRSKSGKTYKEQPSSEDQQQQEFTHDIFTYVHEDNFQPKQVMTMSQTEFKENLQDKNALFMYVYVALQPDTQLVELKWYPEQRVLHIYPDFNSFDDNPYYIEVDNDYRHLYAYALKHVSKQRLQPNEDMLSKRACHALQLSGNSGGSALPFAMPAPHCARAVLLCEIVSASDFVYDNLHVRYQVELPEHALLEEGLLQGSTHACSATIDSCYIGYTFELTLLLKEQFVTGDLLRFYFELISIDNWLRERVEGYAYYATKVKSGRAELQLECLRPKDNFYAALQRYFIGGRRHFDFKRFFNAEQKSKDIAESQMDQQEQNSMVHSRFGCHMQSTGLLTFKCQQIMQQNCELLPTKQSRCSDMNLDDVMQSYREALSRLEKLTLEE